MSTNTYRHRSCLKTSVKTEIMQREKDQRVSANKNDNRVSSQPEPDHQERAVTDTKQPDPSNQPIRKTDPSSHAFHDEEE